MESVTIAELEDVCKKTMDRYVEAKQLTYRYSLRYHEVKRIARESGSFRMTRRKSLVDYAKFDAYIASFFDEEEGKMQRKTDYDNPKLCAEVNRGNKKYVRYHEGAYLYSVGKKVFVELAKKADAVRKIGGVSIVSLDKLNEYIETQYGMEDGNA